MSFTMKQAVGQLQILKWWNITEYFMAKMPEKEDRIKMLEIFNKMVLEIKKEYDI